MGFVQVVNTQVIRTCDFSVGIYNALYLLKDIRRQAKKDGEA